MRELVHKVQRQSPFGLWTRSKTKSVIRSSGQALVRAEVTWVASDGNPRFQVLE